MDYHGCKFTRAAISKYECHLANRNEQKSDHFHFWEHGGRFFGVPLANFLSWYLTCYIFISAVSSDIMPHTAEMKFIILVNKMDKR